jgi:hypothetical protein
MSDRQRNGKHTPLEKLAIPSSPASHSLKVFSLNPQPTPLKRHAEVSRNLWDWYEYNFVHRPKNLRKEQ